MNLNEFIFYWPFLTLKKKMIRETCAKGLVVRTFLEMPSGQDILRSFFAVNWVHVWSLALALDPSSQGSSPIGISAFVVFLENL